MEIKFYKYHGTGNDFILIDAIAQPDIILQINNQVVQAMCHRRFGIGGDGLMILSKSDIVDFKMIYYNSDGNLSSMCGNGGRCISKLAFDLGYIDNYASFEAVDGIHNVQVMESVVALGMNDVSSIECRDNNVFLLDTGSPHYVRFTALEDFKSIVEIGRSVRYNSEFRAKGVNVNLVAIEEDRIKVVTYERGVEDETYSCGTGVVASAISHAVLNKINDVVNISTKGGDLMVSFIRENDVFHNIKLIGPATFVFVGNFEC